MTYTVRLTKRADSDLRRLYAFMYERDPIAADRAREAIENSLKLLREFPFTCRKISSETPFLRELVIEFGRAGYVALFEITGEAAVTVLAFRHQRERDYS